MSHWILVAMLITVNGNATQVTHDPQGLLSSLRQFTGTLPFSDAFHCGDVAVTDAFILECSNWTVSDDGRTSSQCTSVADPLGIVMQREVYNCTPESVSFIMDITGSSTDLSLVEYEAAHNTASEAFLHRLAEFSGYLAAELTLQSLESTHYVLRRGTDSELKVPAVHVRGTLAEPGRRGVEVLVTVIQAAPGVAQVVRFRMHNSTWFLVRDFKQNL